MPSLLSRPANPVRWTLRGVSAPAMRMLGTGMAIAAVAGAALMLDGFVRSEARLLLQSELSAVAEQAVRNAEVPISRAAQVLVEIARGGPVDCLSNTIGRLQARALTAPEIAAFSVVDASGYLMCSSAGEPDRPARLLPEISPGDPSITLAPDRRENRRGLLVAATAANGVRLVAELMPDLPVLPAGPAFTEGRMSVSLGVADRGVWRRTGLADENAAGVIAAREESSVYPVIAEAFADAGAVPAGFRRIELGIVAAGGLAAGAIFIFGWRRRGKRQRTAPASRTVAHATPAYRPVIEIDTGEIVGVDVVLDENGDGALDASLVEQLLAEMSPILSSHRELKLSLPPAVSGRALEGVAAALTRLLPKHEIDPRQIVLTAAPSAAAGAIDAVRAAGARLALDRVLSNEGGLMSLATQQPDFIVFGSEVLGGARNLAILSAAAGIARAFDVGIVVRDVEKPEQIEELRSIGVTTATGPAFGFALDAKSISELLATMAPAGGAALVA